MKRFVLVAALLVPSSASAEEPAWDVGLSLGYAAPMGSAERGARTSDTTFGLVPFALDGAYRFTPSIGAALSATYAVGIPTLCATASDCIASRGHDTRLVASARFFLPHVGRLEPHVDVGLGWEWLTSTLSDAGATSSRSYNGPILLQVDLAAPFTLGRTFTVGPVASAALGSFAGTELETDAFTTHRAVDEHAVHAWLSLLLRASARF